jgi:hypothetical protein
VSASNPNPGDIDARLQFLLTSTESLHASCQELHAASANHAVEIAALSKQTSDLVTATGALLLISRSHKERLDNLDGGNNQ